MMQNSKYCMMMQSKGDVGIRVTFCSTQFGKTVEETCCDLEYMIFLVMAFEGALVLSAVRICFLICLLVFAGSFASSNGFEESFREVLLLPFLTRCESRSDLELLFLVSRFCGFGTPRQRLQRR